MQPDPAYRPALGPAVCLGYVLTLRWDEMRECDRSALPLPSLEGGRKGGLGVGREPE